MNSPAAQQTFPRAPLLGAAALLGAVLLLVAGVRVTGMGSTHNADAPAVASRELQFEDRPDGSIAVTDRRTHELVESVSGQQGFLRGTLRGLARERRREGIGSDEPFLLTAHADGRLSLEDTATKRRVDLESFGPTNEAVFASMLGLNVSPAAPKNP